MNQLILIQDLGMRKPKETSKYTVRYGLYKCFCGKEFESIIENVNSNKTKSCGCTKITHGLRSHRLYNTWVQMIQRCNNPKSKSYKDYGKRNIKVCDEWLNISNFIEDMYPSFQEGLTLDRKENDKGYFKENCRWSTKEVQNRNTKKLQNNNTSGYRGVCLYKNKWISKIKTNSKNIHLGYFDTAIEAAKAYDDYVIKHNLEHTKNFN